MSTAGSRSTSPKSSMPRGLAVRQRPRGDGFPADVRPNRVGCAVAPLFRFGQFRPRSRVHKTGERGDRQCSTSRPGMAARKITLLSRRLARRARPRRRRRRRLIPFPSSHDRFGRRHGHCCRCIVRRFERSDILTSGDSLISTFGRLQASRNLVQPAIIEITVSKRPRLACPRGKEIRTEKPGPQPPASRPRKT